jgi:hypothetical protein
MSETDAIFSFADSHVVLLPVSSNTERVRFNKIQTDLCMLLSYGIFNVKELTSNLCT